MHFKEIQINNRLQIDIETDSGLDTYRGIVIDIDEDELLLVTDFGKLISVNRNDVLSITKISFDRAISTSIMNIKNYYQEKKELEDKLEALIKQEPNLIEELFDANMLARFNIEGAQNRLDKSISQDLLNFSRGIYSYHTYFSSNPNDEIELIFKVSNSFEHYSSENLDMDKVIRVHAPNERDVILKSFGKIGQVREIEKNVVHEKENYYTVFTVYKMLISVDAESFAEIRKEIVKGLKNLKK